MAVSLIIGRVYCTNENIKDIARWRHLRVLVSELIASIPPGGDGVIVGRDVLIRIIFLLCNSPTLGRVQGCCMT